MFDSDNFEKFCGKALEEMDDRNERVVILSSVCYVYSKVNLYKSIMSTL